MSKRVRKEIVYTDINTSDSDPSFEIVNISQIPSNTSKWSKEDCISLKILYVNACSIEEIVPEIDNNINNDNVFGNLILGDIDKYTISNATEHTITCNTDGSRRNSKLITIIRKIKSVINNEIAEVIRETRVDSFVMTLFYYIGFDDDPFLLHPQYDYTAVVGDYHSITSKVDFMVTKKDLYVLFVVEDKHPKGTSGLTGWSENQIAGEIFCSAYHNIDINSRDTESILSYPLCIYAIRVVGTSFTFYRSDVTKEYLEECAKGLPSKHYLTIRRYPEQPEACINTVSKLNAWDFCNPQERRKILITLKALYKAGLKETS